MNKKEREFMLGREQGFRFGISTLESYGVDYLEKDIEFRKNSRINSDVETESINEIYYDEERNCMYESMILIVLNVLYDKFGIGTKRASYIFQDLTNKQKSTDNKTITDIWNERNHLVNKLGIEDFQFVNRTTYSRVKPYDEGRIAGMEYILRLAKEEKTEEIKAKKSMLPKVKIPRKNLVKMSEEATEMIRRLHYDLLMFQMVDVIHERLGFGEKRMKNYLKQWDEKSSYLDHPPIDDILDSYFIRWDDLAMVIREELKINVSTEYMKKRGMLEVV